jgi:hypothetical protein
MGPKSYLVEQGRIEGIPAVELLVSERDPNPPPKPVLHGRRLVVMPMEGVTDQSDPD